MNLHDWNPMVPSKSRVQVTPWCTGFNSQLSITCMPLSANMLLIVYTMSDSWFPQRTLTSVRMPSCGVTKWWQYVCRHYRHRLLRMLHSLGHWSAVISAYKHSARWHASVMSSYDQTCISHHMIPESAYKLLLGPYIAIMIMWGYGRRHLGHSRCK